MIRNLSGMSSIPWCIIGDFNDLLSNKDKCGHIGHPTWLLSSFKETILDCELSDILLEGYPFTWRNSRGSDDAVEKRLNLAMATAFGLVYS